MKQSLFLLSIFCLMLSCKSLSTKSASKQVKPNIVFILADDLGYMDLSCMGSAYYETPNIDRIAQEGVMFTNGYAACQVCSPSRASIMSGKFPARHGITDWIGAKTGEAWRSKKRFNQLLPPDYVHQLPQEYTTLPEALKENGYKTFFAGKWHLGKEGSWPEDHGFDINKGGWEVGSPIGGYYSPWKNPNLDNKEAGENLSMRLAKETAQFIEAHKDTALFAFLSFYAVHGPIQTTQAKWEKYRNKAANKGIAEEGYKMGHFLPIRQTQDNPIYAGLVETMDDAVGIVLKKLEKLGLAENTIVVFTSDNGGVAAGDAFSTSNLPMRAGKGYQFEGGIREPYFIKAPQLKTNLKQCDAPVTGTDFYPTLLELVGADLKPLEHADGKSLVPLLQGKQLPERPLIWHYPHYGNQGGEPSSIIRKGKWKLIHYYEDERQELYDLTTDPSEESNIAVQHPNVVAELHKTLFDYLKAVDAKFPMKDPVYDAALEAQHLKKVASELLPKLEKQRLKFLSSSFDPENNWWGSQVED